MLAVILTIFAAAVVIVIGWRVYDTYNQTKDGNGQAGQQAEVNPNDGYVVIAEWGIRFKPSEGLDGVIYKVRSAANGTEYAHLSTTNIVAKLGDACGVDSDYSALGMIARQPSVDTIAPGYAVKKQVGDSTFLYYTPQTGCSNDPSMDDELSRDLSLTRTSIDKLEAIQ